MITEKISNSPGISNSNAPLISIILVCLNNEKTIEQTLQSIIHLDYPNIEFIIIDGESSDGTINILNRYKNYVNSLVTEKDSGIFDAMNKGIKLATGDFLYFVGADDIIINSWYNLIGKLKSGNTVYYGNVYFPLTNRIYDGKFSYIKLLNWNICHQAIFYPKAVFEKYQYSSDYPLLADYHLNLLLNSNSSFKFQFIDIIIAIFSEKGITNKMRDKKFQFDHLGIIRENYCFIFYLYLYLRRVLEKWLDSK